jgi:hypothetical protein
MLRILVALLPLALAADTADACSCVRRTLAEHAKAATRVVLARAGKPIKTGDALKQTFTVLATFKGPTQPTFVLDRRATPPCKADYADGEIAILFSSDTQLDPCHGNLPLASQAADLPAILAATSTKQADATVDAVDAALRPALSRYLHQRAQIPIRYAPLAGKSLTIDKSKLTFAKAATAGDIELTTAFTAGDVAFVQGRYATEGVRFVVVLYLDKTWKVAHLNVAEK